MCIYTFCTWAGIKLFALTLRFYLTPVKKVILRNINDKRCWHVGKGVPYTLLVEVQPPWKSTWRFLKALEIELIFDPALPLLGVCTKDFMS